MNRMAICISGQIRNDDSSLKAIMASLSGIDADIYLSVWKRRGSKDFSGFNGRGHLVRILGQPIAYSIPRSWIRMMGRIFPESSSIFPSLGNVTDTDLRQYFPKAIIDIEEEDIDFSFPHGDRNSFRMLYKIWRCNSLMRKAEISHGKRYETVVRMRPDINLNFNQIAQLKLKKNELISMPTMYTGTAHLGDMFWVGNSEVIDLMAGGFSRAIEAKNGNWRGIHRELYDLAVDSHLDINIKHLITAGVGHFANFNAEFSRATERNFIRFVKERKMDVTLAGGEGLCAITEHILSATLSEIEGREFDSNQSQLQSKITKYATQNPERAAEVYLMGASYMIGSRKINIRARFEFLIYFIELELLSLDSHHRPTLLHYISGATETFENQKPQLLDMLVSYITDEKSDDRKLPNIPNAWKSDLNDGERVTKSDIYSCILESNKFCNSLVNINPKGSELAIISLIEAREKIGICNASHYHKAAHACELLGDSERGNEFREKARTRGC